ncbi:hypothetical protein CC80DRAFT_592216 [Byssothecium circinans]|uniref:Uncharacterized protein n=1 Tax=Byssothecium circinans TaxID=147558 RepID=A0A6A5U080_9PLEO|nr:hypothetical protein CC80DRAFT_592216 [Byssothecium circinans]
MKSATILVLGLAAAVCAQQSDDSYLDLKPTGSEVVVTYSGQVITIPVFNPTNAPTFGAPKTLAPPANPTVSFSAISGPIPSSSSSLAPPATVPTSFSVITTSIVPFPGSTSSSASSSASPSTTPPPPSSSAAPSPSPSSTSQAGNNGGYAMRPEIFGVIAGGLVAGLALV